MRSLGATLLACALLAATPAFAGIAQINGTGTGHAIADATFNAGSSVNLTTTADTPVGSLAIIIAQSQTSGVATGFSIGSGGVDIYGNTWSAGQAITANNGAAVMIFYSYTTFDIPNSGTETVNVTGLSGVLGTMLSFSGSASTPYDSASATGKISSAASPISTNSTGALNGPCGSANCEVLIGTTMRHANGTVMNDSNFTAVSGSGSAGFINGFWIVSASTAEVYTTSSTSTSNYAGQLQGFKAASAAGNNNRLMMRGIP